MCIYVCINNDNKNTNTNNTTDNNNSSSSNNNNSSSSNNTAGSLSRDRTIAAPSLFSWVCSGTSL